MLAQLFGGVSEADAAVLAAVIGGVVTLFVALRRPMKQEHGETRGLLTGLHERFGRFESRLEAVERRVCRVGDAVGWLKHRVEADGERDAEADQALAQRIEALEEGDDQ